MKLTDFANLKQSVVNNITPINESSIEAKKEHIEKLFNIINHERQVHGSRLIQFEITDDLTVVAPNQIISLEMDHFTKSEVTHLLKDGHLAFKFSGTLFQLALHGEEFTSLKGCPPSVTNFIVDNTNITNLEGCPQQASIINLANNEKLTSLKGLPSTLQTSQPKLASGLTITNCPQIKSFEGMPSNIQGSLNISYNGFTSLANLHKHVKKMKGSITIDDQITSSILSVMLIDGVTKINLSSDDRGPLYTAVQIINRHLQMSDPDPMDCKDELVQAGLQQFARAT